MPENLQGGSHELGLQGHLPALTWTGGAGKHSAPRRAAHHPQSCKQTHAHTLDTGVLVCINAHTSHRLSHDINTPIHSQTSRSASEPGSSFPTPAPRPLSWTPYMAAQGSWRSLEIRATRMWTLLRSERRASNRLESFPKWNRLRGNLVWARLAGSLRGACGF